VFDPPVPIAGYGDSFGNWCTHVVAPRGRICVSAEALLNDAAAPDAIVPHSQRVPVPDLPEQTLLFLRSPQHVDELQGMDR
jgi:hypothetical protein